MLVYNSTEAARTFYFDLYSHLPYLCGHHVLQLPHFCADVWHQLGIEYWVAHKVYIRVDQNLVTWGLYDLKLFH